MKARSDTFFLSAATVPVFNTWGHRRAPRDPLRFTAQIPSSTAALLIRSHYLPAALCVVLLSAQKEKKICRKNVKLNTNHVKL